MKSFIYNILIGIVFCVFMTSCEGEVVYNYIISNNSSQNIHLILYPDEKNIIDDSYHNKYGNGYLSNNGFWYIVTFLGNEKAEFDCPLQSLELKSGESVNFSIGRISAINENPEIYGTYAIWLNKNCIQKILIEGDTDQSWVSPISLPPLSLKYWTQSSNWIIQNKKSDSIEYWLVIDDEVIREHGTAAD